MTTAPSETQIIQDAANMGVLARQAIANGFPTMEVDPKICANVALLVERLMQTTDEAPVPESTPSLESLADARAAGHREAIRVSAQGRADSLQRIAELESSCENLNTRLLAAVAERDALLPPLTVDAEGAPVRDAPGQTLIPDDVPASATSTDFKGPGQN